MAAFTPRYLDYDFLDKPILSSSTTDIFPNVRVESLEQLKTILIRDYILPWNATRDFKEELFNQFQKGKGKKLKSIIEKVIGKPIKEGNYITYEERDLLKSSNALKNYLEEGYTTLGKGLYKDLSKISEPAFSKLKEDIKTKLSGKVSSTELNKYLGNIERIWGNKTKPKHKFVQLLLRDVPRLEPDEDGDLKLWVVLGNLTRSDEERGVLNYSLKDLEDYLKNPEKFDILVSPGNKEQQKVVENFIAYAKELGKDFEVLPPGKGVVKPQNFDGGVLEKNETTPDTPHNLGDKLYRDRGEMDALEYMSTLVKENPLSGRPSEEGSVAVLDFSEFRLTDKDYRDTNEEKIESKLSTLAKITRQNIDQAQKSPLIYYFQRSVYERMFNPEYKNADVLKNLIYSDGRDIKRRGRRKNVRPATGFTFEHIIPINIIITILQMVKKDSPETFNNDAKKILDKLYKVCWITAAADNKLDTANKSTIPSTLERKIGIQRLEKEKSVNKDEETFTNFVYEPLPGKEVKDIIKNIENLSEEDTLLRYKRININDLIPLSQVFQGGSSVELKNYTNEELKLPSNVVRETVSLMELIGKK